MATTKEIIEQNKEEIIISYTKNYESLTSIGNRFGVSHSTIRKYLDKWGIGIVNNPLGRRKNLIGQKFGKLTVISLDEEKTAANKRTYWFCSCECNPDKKISIRGDALTSGKKISCGCTWKEKLASKAKDISGQRFGKLIALEPTKERDNSRNVIWKCQCDCSAKTICYVSRHSLIHGYTTSCGCIKSKGEEKIAKVLTENNIKFVKEYAFNDFSFSDTKAKAKFDFFVNNKYLIEFDGIQHFHSSETGWANENRLKYTIQHDIEKNQYCLEKNIPLIRIPYSYEGKIDLKILTPTKDNPFLVDKIDFRKEFVDEI